MERTVFNISITPSLLVYTEREPPVKSGGRPVERGDLDQETANGLDG